MQAEAIDRVILETAQRLFMEEGYADVTMDGVASVAGVSKVTLYARHGSKEQLFRHLVEVTIARWSSEANEVDDIGGPAFVKLRARVRHVALSIANPEVVAFKRLLDSTRDRFPELSRAMYEVGFVPGNEALAALIEATAQERGMEVRDAPSVAALLVCALAGWHDTMGMSGEVTTRALIGFADRVLDVTLGGIGTW
ncbi:TetR/AcrR family transcriptional regulator [Sphingomonas sp.]|uniref:TetR/AcrR family transcriptional regulator n=1 Tax=Sphingomonas sp. TaxID=28214 RepID=UPI0035C84C66